MANGKKTRLKPTAEHELNLGVKPEWQKKFL